MDDSALEFAHFHSTGMFLGPGARLGPYAIQAAIGAGGIGRGLQGTRHPLERIVAIKILPEALTRDTQSAHEQGGYDVSRDGRM